MTLQRKVLDALRAGSLVTVVQEPDEVLAIESIKMAAKALPPGRCEVLSVLADDFNDRLVAHQMNGTGVVIIPDFLSVFGSNSAAIRRLREFALQTKAPPYPRVVLVERPGIEIPPSLIGDTEFISPPLPSVEELKQELEVFIKDQGIKLEGNGEVRAAIAQALSGLARHEAARLLARCWVELKKLDDKWLAKAKAERITGRSKQAVSFVSPVGSEVGGLEVLREYMITRAKAFGSEKARKRGLPELKGLLLTGVPGTGKSLAVRYIARLLGVPLMRLDVGKMYGGIVGQTEAQTREALATAIACAPCVLWIDEVEKAIQKGGSNATSDVSSRLLGTLLTWLQEKTEPVFVVCTANSVTQLPPELLRKGRFDEIFFVDLPTQEERVEIARIHLVQRNKKVEDVLPTAIADATDGFGGAEIEQAIVDGMFAAYADGDRELTTADVLAAVKGTTPISKTMAEDIAKTRAWAKGRAKSATKNPRPDKEDGSGYSRTIIAQ